MYTNGEVPTIPKQKYFNKNTKTDTTDYSTPKSGFLSNASRAWAGQEQKREVQRTLIPSVVSEREASGKAMGVQEELKDVLNTGATKVVNFFEKLGRKSPELTVSPPSNFRHTASPDDLPNMTYDEAILEKMQPAQESFSRPVPRHISLQQKAQGRRLSFGGMPGVYTCDQCGGYKFKKRSRRSSRRSSRSSRRTRHRRSSRRSRHSNSHRRSRRSRRSRKSRSVKRRSSRKTRRTRGSSSRRSRRKTRKTRRNRSKRSRRTVKKGGKRRSNKNQITPCD